MTGEQAYWAGLGPEDVYGSEEDPYREEHRPVEFNESYRMEEPDKVADGWRVRLFDEDNQIVAEVYHRKRSFCISRSINLAAAAHLESALEWAIERLEGGDPFDIMRLKNACLESLGVDCTGCDERGQPSRMVYSPDNHAYHPECLPDKIRAQMARLEQAADLDGDCPF